MRFEAKQHFKPKKEKEGGKENAIENVLIYKKRGEKT